MFDFLQGPSDPTHTLIYTHIHILYTSITMFIYIFGLHPREGRNE